MTRSDHTATRTALYALITLGGLLLILGLRLIPFNFATDGASFGELLGQFTWRPLTFQDIPINILLFIPFSFGLMGLLRQTGRSLGTSQILVLVIAGLLTVGLEVVQLFMPERVSSFADIAANLIGALTGILLYRMWEYGVVRAIVDYATLARIALAVGLYAAFVAAFTLFLTNSVRLDNWDPAYPLALGRELTGERPWRGTLENLFFLDRALTEAEMAAAFAGTLPSDTLAAYPLTGSGPFADSTGTLPPLQWRGEAPNEGTNDGGATVSVDTWLETENDVAAWSNPSAAASAFTVGVTVLPERPRQRGPARIVTVSTDTSRRNVTIGQQAEHLTVRLRTPSSGENGQSPEIVVPGVLGDGQQHQIIVTYDAPLLAIYVDDETGRHAVSLAPGLALFRDFARENRWLVPVPDSPDTFNLYYWLLMVGPALLLLAAVLLIRWLGGRRLTR